MPPVATGNSLWQKINTGWPSFAGPPAGMRRSGQCILICRTSLAGELPYSAGQPGELASDLHRMAFMGRPLLTAADDHRI